MTAEARQHGSSLRWFTRTDRPAAFGSFQHEQRMIVCASCPHTHTRIYIRGIYAQSDLTSQAASTKLNDACVSVNDKAWSA
jgi:hypothetical protein